MGELTRLQRKREKTRSALLNAARGLVCERGHDKISIQDLTDRADVGVGTFYNYFESKQHVYEAVLEEIRFSFNQQLTELRKPIKDPATILTVTLLYSFQQAQDNEDWRTFLTYSGLGSDHILHQDEEQCLSDIRFGAQRGRFKVDNVQFTSSLIIGMVRHVSREITLGNLSRNSMQETTRYILRMLGLPDLVAKALVQAPLPPIPASKKSKEIENQTDFFKMKSFRS